MMANDTTTRDRVRREAEREIRCMCPWHLAYWAERATFSHDRAVERTNAKHGIGCHFTRTKKRWPAELLTLHEVHS